MYTLLRVKPADRTLDTVSRVSEGAKVMASGVFEHAPFAASPSGGVETVGKNFFQGIVGNESITIGKDRLLRVDLVARRRVLPPLTYVRILDPQPKNIEKPQFMGFFCHR